MARKLALPLLVAVFAVLATACGGAETGRSDSPPNLLLVLVDTLRADHTSLYGYERETTPVLDRLAAESVVFTHAHSQSGCTFPSVNSLLTSRYPQTFLARLDEHGMAIPPDLPVLPEILAGHGWSTAAVSASPIVRATPSEINRQGGFDRGFGVFDEGCHGKRAPCLVARAAELLDELPEPFFLYLHFMEPHGPYRPPAWHERRFATGEPDRLWVAKGEPERIARKLYEGEDVPFGEEDLAHFVDLYDEEIRFFDSQLGELWAELEARGLDRSTLVVFLSDHGEELLDHRPERPHFGHCRDLAFETVTATPLLLRLPGGAHAGRHAALADNLDVVPTLLDLLGVEPGAVRFAGESLVPLIEDGRRVRRYSFSAQGTTRTVTDGAWKLVHVLEGGERRLYHLERDPGEMHDLAAARPGEAERLGRVLDAWMERVEAGGAASLREAEEHEAALEAVGYL